LQKAEFNVKLRLHTDPKVTRDENKDPAKYHQHYLANTARHITNVGCHIVLENTSSIFKQI